ncbi:MAG: spore coat protein [Lachnospiraceae bacterium]|jgi:spore coat protein CotF|nr:spore coat protein [Lachnospiraceae bacterium]
MDEKYMVNDILEGIKASLTTYQGVISEAANTQLRQTIQQIRNSDEAFQYELYKVAAAKGYYKPAGQATQEEITQVKNDVSQ